VRGGGLELDRFDFEAGELAAVAFGFMVALPALVFEVDHFVGAVLEEHFGADAGTFEFGITDAQIAAVTVEEHVINAHSGAFGGIEFFNVDLVALGDAVLFAAGFDDCESHKPDSENEIPARAMIHAGGGKGALLATPLFGPQVFFGQDFRFW
jgi:hypothetical protein